MEIAAALDRIVGAPNFETGAAWKLADAVSGRDQAIQFDLFNRHVLDQLGERASSAALAGDLVAAERMSVLWQEASQTISETEAYNLDKRQHVAGLTRRVHEVLTSSR